MADRVKRRWRGRTYSVKSTRPGRKTVWVKGHCRGKPTSSLARSQRSARQVKEWGF